MRQSEHQLVRVQALERELERQLGISDEQRRRVSGAGRALDPGSDSTLTAVGRRIATIRLQECTYNCARAATVAQPIENVSVSQTHSPMLYSEKQLSYVTFETPPQIFETLVSSLGTVSGSSEVVIRRGIVVALGTYGEAMPRIQHDA